MLQLRTNFKWFWFEIITRIDLRSYKILNLAKLESNKKKSERIKGSDFRAWDKYDAEEECQKVDDPEFVSTKKKVS